MLNKSAQVHAMKHFSLIRSTKQLLAIITLVVSSITAIIDDRSLTSATLTNRPRFTASSLPWWSPIQVLTEVDVPLTNNCFTRVWSPYLERWRIRWARKPWVFPHRSTSRTAHYVPITRWTRIQSKTTATILSATSLEPWRRTCCPGRHVGPETGSQSEDAGKYRLCEYRLCESWDYVSTKYRLCEYWQTKCEYKFIK